MTRKRLILGGALALGLVTMVSPIMAHVKYDSPDGGQVFTEGDTITIEWHVQVMHNTQNWDLKYSIGSASGPWMDIAVDLPAGDISTGAPHSYDWTIPPEVVSAQVWVRVWQDNSGTDYSDQNDDSFTILPIPPEFDVTLTQSELITGQDATLEVSDAGEGEIALFLLSAAGIGAGPCYAGLGGLCLDILLPFIPIGFAITDGTGTGTLTLPMPLGAPLIEVFTQVLVLRGPSAIDSVKSNPVAAFIQNSP